MDFVEEGSAWHTPNTWILIFKEFRSIMGFSHIIAVFRALIAAVGVPGNFLVILTIA